MGWSGCKGHDCFGDIFLSSYVDSGSIRNILNYGLLLSIYRYYYPFSAIYPFIPLLYLFILIYFCCSCHLRLCHSTFSPGYLLRPTPFLVLFSKSLLLIIYSPSCRTDYSQLFLSHPTENKSVPPISSFSILLLVWCNISLRQVPSRCVL